MRPGDRIHPFEFWLLAAIIVLIALLAQFVTTETKDRRHAQAVRTQPAR